jgi:hypothetical protein
MWNKTQKKKINHGGSEGTEVDERFDAATLIFLCELCVLCGQILALTDESRTECRIGRA